MKEDANAPADHSALLEELEHFRQEALIHQHGAGVKRGFLVVGNQPLVGQSQDALRGPDINLAPAEHNALAAPFERNFAVLHPPLNVGGREVQIAGNGREIEKFGSHHWRVAQRVTNAPQAARIAQRSLAGADRGLERCSSAAARTTSVAIAE